MTKIRAKSSVGNVKRRASRILNETTQIAVLGILAVNPTTSFTKVSSETRISSASIHKLINMDNFDPLNTKYNFTT